MPRNMEVAVELGSGERWRNFEKHDRKSSDCLEQDARRMWTGESSEKSEKCVYGNLKQDIQYQKAQQYCGMQLYEKQ